MGIFDGPIVIGDGSCCSSCLRLICPLFGLICSMIPLFPTGPFCLSSLGISAVSKWAACFSCRSPPSWPSSGLHLDRCHLWYPTTVDGLFQQSAKSGLNRNNSYLANRFSSFAPTLSSFKWFPLQILFFLLSCQRFLMFVTQGRWWKMRHHRRSRSSLLQHHFLPRHSIFCTNHPCWN